MTEYVEKRRPSRLVSSVKFLVLVPILYLVVGFLVSLAVRSFYSPAHGAMLRTVATSSDLVLEFQGRPFILGVVILLLPSMALWLTGLLVRWTAPIRKGVFGHAALAFVTAVIGALAWYGVLLLLISQTNDPIGGAYATLLIYPALFGVVYFPIIAAMLYASRNWNGLKALFGGAD